MRIAEKDLKPRVIKDLGVKRLMVPGPDGQLQLQDCKITSFGLGQYQMTISLAGDHVSVACPTKPRTDCATTIEFDLGEIERPTAPFPLRRPHQRGES